MMRTKILNNATLYANFKFDTFEKRIKKMLFGFLLKELIIYTLIDKGREFALRVSYM